MLPNDGYKKVKTRTCKPFYSLSFLLRAMPLQKSHFSNGNISKKVADRYRLWYTKKFWSWSIQKL